MSQRKGGALRKAGTEGVGSAMKSYMTAGGDLVIIDTNRGNVRIVGPLTDKQIDKALSLASKHGAAKTLQACGFKVAAA